MQKMFDDDKFYSKQTIVDTLNCSMQFLDKEIKAGNIKAKKFGKALVRIKGSDINKYIEDGEYGNKN